MRQFIVIIQLSLFLPALCSQSLIKNINLGAQGSNINHLQSATSGIIFTANDEDGSRILCFTNDTISEPHILYNSGNPPADQWIWAPKAVGDSVFYFTYSPDKVQLFMVDPLTQTTTFLKEWQNANGISDDLGHFTRVGNLIYFITRFTNYQFELWSTDGSASGTNFAALLPSNSFPINFTELGGKLVFSLNLSIYNNDLWSYDGINLIEFMPDPTPYNLNLIKYKNTLYFNAQSDSAGFELFNSDGTVNGTGMLKDIYQGGEDSYPNQFVIFDETLYFSAKDSAHGYELWKSDGTEAGTQLAADVHPGPNNSWPSSMSASEHHLFFTAFDSMHGNELWVLEKTNGNPVRLTDIAPGAENTNFGVRSASDSLLFFVAEDSLTGLELYRSDGTPDGTLLIKDIFPGIENSDIKFLTQHQGIIYFNANDCIHGNELWSSNGSMEGTSLKHDININEDGSFPYRFKKVLGNKVIFIADEKKTGFEPYISDGTENGTFLLKDINFGNSSSNPRHFVELDSQVYFLAAYATFDNKLYRTNGTPSGTEIAVDKKILNKVAVVNNGLVMDISDPAFGTEPWFFDGDSAYLLKDINASGGSHPQISDMVFNNEIYFTADDGLHGYELWKTDGTPNGTILFKDLVPGPQSSNISFLTAFDSFFLFSGGFNGFEELYISDGTTEGTILLKDIYPGGRGNPSGFYKYHNEIFFRATNHLGAELWKTDGTSVGTTLVKDINSSGSSYPEYFIEAGGKLFFTATTNDHGAELWCSDGTTEGTLLLMDINQGPGHSYPRDFISIGNVIIFSAEDSLHGREIWKSDGTPEGTQLLIDFLPGPLGSDPGPFIDLDGQIIFGANNGILGKELWDLSNLCIAPLNLTVDNTPIPSGIYQAVESIQSSSTININQEVHFIAGDQVDLFPGFEVNTPTLFSIQIENCGN